MSKESEYVWREVFPHRFASLDLVRHSTFAFACLNLWPFVDLGKVLENDNSAILLLDDHGFREMSFTHVFDSQKIFENGKDSIYLKSADYFHGAIMNSRDTVNGMSIGVDLANELVNIYLSNQLVFAYLGFHPHCVVPLVLLDSLENVAHVSDLLALTSSMRNVHDMYAAAMEGTIVGKLIYTGLELKLRFPTRKLKLATELRNQLNVFYKTTASFLEINSAMSEQHEALSQTILVFERCLNITIWRKYPIPLLRFLFFLPDEFAVMARAQHPFAIRILFIYSCLAIFCGFHLLRDSNVWMEFVEWHVTYQGPLNGFEQAFYNHTVASGNGIAYCRFPASLIELDEMLPRFAGREVPESMDFFDF